MSRIAPMRRFTAALVLVAHSSGLFATGTALAQSGPEVNADVSASGLGQGDVEATTEAPRSIGKSPNLARNPVEDGTAANEGEPNTDATVSTGAAERSKSRGKNPSLSRAPTPREPTTDPESETPEVAESAVGGGSDTKQVSPQAISVPTGAGSIQGMGESFSAQLSTGIATFSVPFALPKARGGAQPSLGLSYSSSGGHDAAGQGFGMSVPFIARQTDRGLPGYDDRADWHPNQDRFVFNGGQELVPICTVGGDGSCTGKLEGEVMPSWANGFQYFRPHVEGSFLRFFWSPDHLTWIVQDKSGTTMELGAPRLSGGPATGGTVPSGIAGRALERNPERPSEIYRWHLTRQYDQHLSGGVTGAPLNVVLYDYRQEGGKSYLSDIYDTPPVDGSGGAAQLGEFAHHAHLEWEARSDPTFSYRSGFRIDDTLRLIRVDVTSKTFLGSTADARRLLRRYHLSYDKTLLRSLLTGVQVEGRCAGAEQDAPAEDANGIVPTTSCPRLSPMTFAYQRVTGYRPGGRADSSRLPGFEGFDGRIVSLTGSPKHSIDEDLTDFFDVNADSLPDVLVTATGLYGDGHAVFFGGANGDSGFGGPTSMRLYGVLGANSNTLKLSNRNLSPQDFDGDGRINLLHAPKVKTYSAYDARKVKGSWAWVGREIETADGQNVKIDFGGDADRTKILDVNFDGLVDVMVSTGKELQTFFALGRYARGDGQFGSASWMGPDSARISNAAVVTCLPHSGTPISFADKDIQLADMNGDGLIDLVRLRRGDIQYWPGRGNGVFGTGARDDCPGGFATGRSIEMATAPQYSDIEGSTLRLSDVNGDGLDDLVQINFDSVDLYLNVNGLGWTDRHILDGTPHHAGFNRRVRITDLNGSGTPDLVWGDGRAYKLIDLAGGKVPYLLTGVENGLGKRSAIEYSSSATEMLRAEAMGECDAQDPWSGGWCEKMPIVTQVVKRVTEFDNVTVRGRPPAAYVTEYEYRDPVFEGRQREFRGFRRARAIKPGDTNSPTDVSESVFLLGECLGADGKSWDGVDQEHACAPPLRWRDNEQEALKGLPVETHALDFNGAHLSSAYNTYAIRTLYAGLDGRSVRHAFLEGTDTLLYDSALGLAGASRVRPSYPQGQPIGYRDDGFDVDLPALPTPGASVASGALTVAYAPGMAHLRARTLVDAFGNKVASINSGCVGGPACPLGSEGTLIEADETITGVSSPTLVTHPSGWLWRTGETSIVGSRRAPARNQKTISYDALGRPSQTAAQLLGVEALERTQTGSAPGGGAADGVFIQGIVFYDTVGNPVRSRGQNDRCSSVAYDTNYALFAVAESVATDPGVNPIGSGGDCVGALLTTTAAYDMGLGAVTLASDYHLRNTLAVYDGFGRVTALHKPSATITGSGPTYSVAPSVVVNYFLPGCAACATNSLPPDSHHSIVHSRTQDGADETVLEYLESYAYVDGFGRTLVTLAEADVTADGAPFIADSLLEWDAKGAVSKKYLPIYYTGPPMEFGYEGLVSSPYGRQRYDAFGRQAQTFDLDGTITLQSRYHALSTDLWDAGDLYPGPHQGSYASERKDGHGRTIQTTERFRDAGILEERFVRTRYLPSGEPEIIGRVRGGSGGTTPVVRWMRYDSLGRLILNAEPNTTKNFSSDPYAANASMKAWRYLYNYSSDLIGTSDARGCGQNLFYDAVGRLLGEDYTPCETTHAAYTAATSGTDSTNLEVIYYYDSETKVVTGAPAGWVPGFSKGKLIATFDRGSASFSVFDGRGRTTRALLKLAHPKELNASGTPDAALAFANRYAARVYQRNFAYDAADRATITTTGVDELVAATGNGTSPVKDLRSGGTAASTITTNYSRRGATQSVGSSYGPLINSITRTADHLVTGITYGDIAATQTAYLYDERRRISSVQTFRGPPSSGWSPAGSPTEPTQQLLLQDEDFRYDMVGNPVEIRDWRDAADWPGGAKPSTRKIEYDDLNRATKVDYQYASGTDPWTSPFATENVASQGGAANDPRRATPNPQVTFTSRVLRQTFEYDWLGNTEKTGDDVGGFYDRSLGTITHNGAAGKNYQLNTASLTGARGGSVKTLYDDAGNLTRMDLTRTGPCAPTNATCSHRYSYHWDEVGRLVRGRRWNVTPSANVTDPLPATTPVADLRFTYNAADQRILKEAVDASSNKVYTAYLFDSLELRRARYGTSYNVGSSGSDYEITTFTVVPFLIANGVRVARLVYETLGSVPEKTPGTSADQTNVAVQQLHVILELSDHLGSTSLSIDRATSELTSRSSYQAYGATDADYRPTRWNSFREDYKFTGKEEDAEIGLTCFGKRYLNAYLGRWISADPLAIHAPGEADLNVYAYVSGSILKNIDPLGLETAEAKASSEAVRQGAANKMAELANASRYADLSDRTYDRAGGEAPDREVSMEKLSELGVHEKDLMDPDSGFKAKVFVDESGNYTVAFRGTDMSANGDCGSECKKDWSTNGANGLSLNTRQYEMAMNLAEKVTKAAGVQRVTFTGHSLGGGLAQAAALSVGARAVTFNAAGMSIGTKIRAENRRGERNDELTKKSVNYQVQGEALSYLQNHSDLPKPIGKQVTLSYSAVKGPVARHLMGSVKAAIRQGRAQAEAEFMSTLSPAGANE